MRGAQTSLSLPLSAAIDLHEIHLAPQPSLQVPVGHIVVPGGIKLCSPGTFLVANYLIINNGSCQVNFTKPNSATIRCTNSQWLREDATEMPVGKVTVPKSGRGPFRGRFERDCWIVRYVGMPLEYLWAGWPWRRPALSPLRHARMPLRYLWAWWSFQRPARRPLRHAIT